MSEYSYFTGAMAFSSSERQPADLIKLLRQRFATLDVNAAKRDTAPFLRDVAATEVWSNEFFESLLLKVRAE